jgi:hypothetical protein
MAEKKEETGFKVTDRRLFTTEGEPRPDAVEEPSPAPPVPTAEPATPPLPVAESSPTAGADSPPPPTAAEQKAQHEAYQRSSKDLDNRVELSGHSARELEMTFERFMASLYMTAMLQLGLMHEQGGQPHIDLIGARQTVDTLGLLSEKTKGNLTASESSFLQNCLYELRMAYVEVTNELARPPQDAGTNTVLKPR